TRAVGCLGWTGSDFDAGDITLVPGAALIGRAVDEAGLPLAGVSVMPPYFGAPYGEARYAEWTLVRPALAFMTGADGRFAFDGLWAGRIDMHLRVAGHRPALVEAELKPGESHDAGDIVMQAGAVIEGQILGAQGQPVPHA